MKNETRNENITFFLKSDTFIVSIKSVDIALYECFGNIFGTISTVFALYMPWYKIKNLYNRLMASNSHICKYKIAIWPLFS